MGPRDGGGRGGAVGFLVTTCIGNLVGRSVGLLVGFLVTICMGRGVGIDVGWAIFGLGGDVGNVVGASLPTGTYFTLGRLVGGVDGRLVGGRVGGRVG